VIFSVIGSIGSAVVIAIVANLIGAGIQIRSEAKYVLWNAVSWHIAGDWRLVSLERVASGPSA